MKHPVKQMSLFPSVQEDLPYSEWERDEGERATLMAYIENVGKPPENPPEGSEKWNQWTYTGRKKKDKSTLMNSLET